MSWDEKWIEMARLVASWSKDPSTKVGAVLVRPHGQILVATGYNGPPRGVNDNGHHPGDVGSNSRWYRPQKYLWVEHAERNAIYNAANEGLSTRGCCLYLNWTPHVCADCARAIIQAGIVRVVGSQDPFPGKGELWNNHDLVAEIMLREARVEVQIV
jgi:dCMP deaminase